MAAPPTTDDLCLYGYPSCYYCRRVQHAVQQLGLKIEERNILEVREYRDELRAATGRARVPVLRIEQPDGSVRWMPESRDIVRYLRARFGDAGSDCSDDDPNAGFSLRRLPGR